MDQQKAIWKKMMILIRDFERDRYSFRQLVERLMLVMDTSVFKEGHTVQTWYGQWINMWNLAVAGDLEIHDHLELRGQFIADLRHFLSGELDKLEKSTWVTAGSMEGQP